ncbi:MAG TPA: hypothetical protein VLQ68_00260, partial [Rhizobiaceae bacterium]|nr:hypothetical protein [Rhizobiaceae bacterium]
MAPESVWKFPQCRRKAVNENLIRRGRMRRKAVRKRVNAVCASLLHKGCNQAGIRELFAAICGSACS